MQLNAGDPWDEFEVVGRSGEKIVLRRSNPAQIIVRESVHAILEEKRGLEDLRPGFLYLFTVKDSNGTERRMHAVVEGFEVTRLRNGRKVTVGVKLRRGLDPRREDSVLPFDQIVDVRVVNAEAHPEAAAPPRIDLSDPNAETGEFPAIPEK
jgi:hypothetical protein